MGRKVVALVGLVAFAIGVLLPPAIAQTYYNGYGLVFGTTNYCQMSVAAIDDTAYFTAATIRSVSATPSPCSPGNTPHNLPSGWLGATSSIEAYQPGYGLGLVVICGQVGWRGNTSPDWIVSTASYITGSASECPKHAGYLYDGVTSTRRWNGTTLQYVEFDRPAPQVTFH